MASYRGHEVLLGAMAAAGVTRLVDWGTPSIPFDKDVAAPITVLPKMMAGLFLPGAKREMLAIGRLLEASGLDWTLVRFVAPTNGPRAKKLKVGFGEARMGLTVSREDIGAFMVEQLEDTRFIRAMPILGS